MLLKQFMTQLKEEMGQEFAGTEPGTYAIPYDDNTEVTIAESPQGMVLHCDICPIPEDHNEAFLSDALYGNLFGQGTGGAVLGLSGDHSTLTLHWEGGSDLTEYRHFKAVLEDFLNTVDFWKAEALNTSEPKK
jgi:hypothetical protein